jgi:hypothetical protein
MSSWQFWVTFVALLALGVLGAASLIVKKKPEAKDLIDKLAKSSGYIGVVAALWGLWTIINCLRYTQLLSISALFWISWLAIGLVLAGLGFIFGWGMITTYLSEEAKAKGEELRQKLVGYQLTLGLVSLGLAVWWLVMRFAL